MTTTEQDPSDDLDPAAPQGNTEAPVSDDADRANYGEDGRGDLSDSGGGLEGVEGFGHPAVLAIDAGKARAFLHACMTSVPRVTYGLGKKIKPGQVPGRDFAEVDCSGFVREAIRRSTNLGNAFPDGSVVQHDWIKARGFDRIDRASGATRDGAVRIAFLEPKDSPKKIGHVVLVHDGKTLESHGGVGPDERAWNGQAWQSKAFVYLLKPGAADPAGS